MTPNLGDFILGAISLTIQIPILVVKPMIECKKDNNGAVKTVYNAHVEYLFRGDRKKTTGSDLIVVVYNDLDYYAPAIPKKIRVLTTGAVHAKGSLIDAISQVEEVLETVPASDAHIALTTSLKFMGAAKQYLTGARLATGTATVADAPLQVPIPKLMLSSKSTKMAQKHAASDLQLVPPAKTAKDTDKSYEEKKKKYNAAVQKKMDRSCGMAPNQCYCGEEFDDAEKLDSHQKSIHIDKRSWKCPESECGKVMSSGPKLWTHWRHHQNRWYHYCDVLYKDELDCEEDGTPKEKICTTTCDEKSYMDYHRETDYEVGRTSIRCIHCKKPQLTNRHKVAHESICPKGPAKEGENTDWCDVGKCDYSCRGRSTLHNHKKQYHWEELGLPVPTKYSCSKCNKVFIKVTGMKGHTCKVKKPRHKQSAARGKGKCSTFAGN